VWRRFYALSVGRVGEPPSGAGHAEGAPPGAGAGRVLQFGDDDRPVDSLQCGIIYAVYAQDFESIHCLRARADDGRMCSHMLRLLVMVTPMIFTAVVRSMPGISGGGGCTRVFRRLS